MICPHCGTHNKEENLFCTECGWKLIRPTSTEKDPFARPNTEYSAPEYENHVYQETISDSNAPVRKIGFKEAVVAFFKNYINFKDRSTRSEFWYVELFLLIVDIVLVIFRGAVGDSIADTVSTVWAVAILLPSLGLIWRRMHDIGKSGLHNLWVLIPLIGWIIVLVMYCTGSDADNRFGPRKTDRI